MMQRPISSSLTDKEWAIIEPLLPKKKLTRLLNGLLDKFADGIFSQLLNGCNWCDLPLIPTNSTVYWHYKNWVMERKWQTPSENQN